MSNKIRELNTIFNSFDLKGPKEKIADKLLRFEAETSRFSGTEDCEVPVLWMKNIFLQAMGDFSEAEALLETALARIKASADQDSATWKIKIYMSLGHIHQEQYNFIDAQFFLSKAYDLAISHKGLNNFFSLTCASLAKVSIHLNQYAKAKKYVTQGKKEAAAVYQTQKKDDQNESRPDVEYAYSLIDYCSIKRIIGLVDNTLLNLVEEALYIFTALEHTRGILGAKLESAHLLLELNFTDRALLMIQSIEPTFREWLMHKETIEAGLLTAKVHKKMLDYSLAEAKLSSMVELAQKKQLSNALVMSDVYYEMGQLYFDTDREKQALEFYKSSAKIGMLAGVKRYIFRAFDAARHIDRKEAKIILSSDLLYKDAAFIRNRMAEQGSPFNSENQKQKLYASTLFVDIAGFSTLMKNSDEPTTVQVIDELIDRLCMVIFRHNGYIDKFLGDGFMAIFEHGDTADSKIALNAIRAGIDINRAVHIKNMRFREIYGLDKKISLRMGLSSGEIYALFLGNFIKRQFTFLGNAVNLASKLEAHADKKEILMDQHTYNLVRERVDTCKKELNFKGFGTFKVYGFKGFKLHPAAVN